MKLEDLKELVEIWTELDPPVKEEGEGWFYFADGVELLNSKAQGQFNDLDFSHLKYILLALGLIETPRIKGNSSVRTKTDAKAMSIQVIEQADLVVKKLEATADGRLSREEQQKLREAENITEDRFENIKRILSLMNLANSIQRSGEIRKLDSEDTHSATLPKTLTTADNSKEFYYYPYAETILEQKLSNYDNTFNSNTIAFRTLITGGKGGTLRHGPGASVPSGEFMTPDVVGFHILDTPSILQPTLRVYSIEVKTVLTLSSVGEAEGHQRFSHFVYLFTPESFIDIDPSVKLEAARKGIGLISPSQKEALTFHIQLEAPLLRPDCSEVDALLRDLKPSDEETPLSDVVAKALRDKFVMHTLIPRC